MFLFLYQVQQYNEKADEVAEVLKIYNDHTDMINKVRQRRRDEFMASFKKITIKLKEMYQMITLGGDAELELVDSLDPFSEGVNFRFVSFFYNGFCSVDCTIKVIIIIINMY